MQTRSLLLAAALTLVPALALADAFAPAAKPTAEGSEGMMQKMMMDKVKAKMPDAASVEAPAYPGAVAVYLNESKDGKNLSVVRLVTTDDTAKVAAWYKEKLEGWHEGEKLGENYFWKGSKNWNPAKDGFSVPFVQYAEAFRDEDKSLVKGAKTEITISFGGTPGAAKSAAAKSKAAPKKRGRAIVDQNGRQGIVDQNGH